MTAPFLFVPTFSWPATPGGLLYTYAAGGVTPLATYSDAAGSIPNTNPVVLDANGSATIRLSNSAYHFVLMDPTGSSTVWDQDQYVPEYLTLSAITTLLNPQTAAESAAFVNPSNLGYLEGDIRRYGALTTATDNSGAINAALLVSSNGGSAAYIPGDTWPITSPAVAPPGSSMYGAGATNSIILAANGIDGLQLTTGDTTYGGRSFRDFALHGTISGTTNNAHGVYAVASAFILDVLFENVAVIGFNWGFYLQNLEDCTLFACLIQNCWNGIYFNNQSVNVFLLDNTVNLVSPGTLITGTGHSTGISVQGAPEVEGLHIQGGTLYGYNYAITFGLIFECQIEAVDVSNSSICGIYFTSVLGPLAIRDCWVELGASSTGVWNGGNANQIPGNLTGIFLTAITPSVNSQVTISGNYIISDGTYTGSTGMYLGNSNNGMVVQENHVKNFDVGIGGGNTLVNSGGTFNGVSIKNNTINANTSSILMGASSTELELGPNYIVAGGQATFTSTPPTSMRYEQPNAPMKGTAAFVAATTVAVAFANALPAGMTNYGVALSGNAAGYCWVSAKTASGFTINCSASNSNSVDWTIKA